MNVAYVLLPEAALPDPDAVAEAFSGLFPGAGPLVPAGEAPGGAGDDDAPALALAGATGMVHVILNAAPFEDDHARLSERRSLAAIGQDEPLPEHGAHLIVAWFPAEGASVGDGLLGQAHATAAVTLAAADPIGIYVPAASSTHPADWYVEVARQVEEPIMLWLGVSHAVTEDERHSFLSFGMEQYGLPELLLGAPLSEGSEAIEYFYELIAASVAAGAPIVPGEIVGRQPGELLTAREVPSPVGDELPVIAVDLPD